MKIKEVTEDIEKIDEFVSQDPPITDEDVKKILAAVDGQFSKPMTSQELFASIGFSKE